MTVSTHAKCHEVETLDDGTTLHCDRSKEHASNSRAARRFHWDASRERTFGPTVIRVDLITATKGSVLITRPDMTEVPGWIFHDAKRGGGPGWSAYTAETEDQDERQYASGKNNARNAAVGLARGLDITGPLDIEIIHEYKTTGERD
ncbi:hypothetical protein [Streptomyces sp. NPDC059761]|uniref:hypothetical protein n=1 Tax=Streptomyces sp. NPDC059761 TaxID=3346937 RepID=UPI003658A4A7